MSKAVLHYSSVTKKIIMSLAGLFLISFLVVHLSINLLILFDDTRELFNKAAHFMLTNPLIQTFQWVLFAGFVIHIILGFILQIQNWLARPMRYDRKGSSEMSYFSKFMIHTGVIVLIFLALHMANFFFKVKFGPIEYITYGADTYKDVGALVMALFQDVWYVVFYVISLLLLGFHLEHGFQSAFQSLGLYHKTYTPAIKLIGTLYAVAVTVGYIAIPVVIYFFK
jgi:succinate dehydrogenase / fumarate reductase, cytochrome b subunit